MSGPQLLARQVQRLAAKAIGTRQPDLAGLLANWSDVVGPEWAGRCTPLAFRRAKANQAAMLELAVPSGEALLVQHEAPVLISRINAYFGGPAVKDLRLKPVNSPAHARRREKHVEPLPIEGVDDPDLAASLGRLGAAIRKSDRESD